MPLFILAAARTPFGAFGGALRSQSLVELGAHALRETLARSPIAPEQVHQVILGCALPAGVGGCPARLAARGAGIPTHIPAFSPGAGALSGLKAIALAAQMLRDSPGSFILAGGAESPSRAPYFAPSARWGVRMGESDLLDSLLIDGPLATTELDIPPPGSLDAWAEASRHKADASRTLHRMEIAPLAISDRKGLRLLDHDEPPEASRVTLPRGHAPLADGAATLLLATTVPSGVAPLARILGWTETGDSATEAVRRLLDQLGLPAEAIDRWEIHESSAAQVLALLKAFPALDPCRVNPRGGALALGDPWGATGSRVLHSLALELEAHGLSTGIAVLATTEGPTVAMALSRS